MTSVTTLTWSADPLFRDAAAPVVYGRDSWDDDWEELDGFWCDYLLWCVNPEIPQAQLTWRYGERMDFGDTSFSVVAPLVPGDWLGTYLKLVVTNPADDSTYAWYGVIEQITDDRGGSIARTAVAGDFDFDDLDGDELDGLLGDEFDDMDGDLSPYVRTGRQLVTALGLEILLERTQVTTSVCFKADLSGTFTIGRAIEFNEPNQQADIGNMSQSLDTDGFYVFAGVLGSSDSQFWSTAYIAGYLLQYMTPKNADGDQVIPWEISPSYFAPWWDKPRVVAEKRTVKQLLDQLMDRRRLMGFYLTVDEGDEDAGDTIVLNPFSFNQSNLTVGTNTVYANADQVGLDIDHSPDVESCRLRATNAESFDQVTVMGDRVRAVFTIDGESGTLTAHWSDSDQSTYNAGASAQAGYSALGNSDKNIADDIARSADSLKRVYRYFGPSTTWSGVTYEGSTPYLPADDMDEGESDDPLPFWIPGLRIEHQTPLKFNHDYSGSNIADDAVTDTTPAGQAWEYIPIFAAADVPFPSATSALESQYVNLEHFNAFSRNEVLQSPFAASIRPQELFPGVVLDMGDFPYMIASADFSPAGSWDNVLDEFDSINWRTDVGVTVAIAADQFVQQSYPADPSSYYDDEGDGSGPDALRVLIIDVGSQAKFHWVAPNTVVNVENGELVKSTSGGPIRDDRDLMADIAYMAFQWYGETRQILELSFNLIAFGLGVGQLVAALVDSLNAASDDAVTPVNAVITSVRWEFPEQLGPGPPPMPRTKIITAFGAIDGFAQDAGFPLA